MHTYIHTPVYACFNNELGFRFVLFIKNTKKRKSMHSSSN